MSINKVENEGIKYENRVIGCGVGCLHFVATIFFSLLFVSLEVMRLNRPIPLSQSQFVVDRISGIVYTALQFPLMPLAQMIWHKAEYFAFFIIWPINSLMFGFGLAFFIRKMRR